MSRDRNVAGYLGGVCEETLQDRCAQTGPDESFSDVGIGGIEGMQVGVGFPFLEAYLNLPAKTVQFADGVLL